MEQHSDTLGARLDAARSRYPQLGSLIAEMDAGAVGREFHLHDILLRGLERTAPFTRPDCDLVWAKFLKDVLPEMDDPDWAPTAAVLSNSIAILGSGAAEEYHDFAALVDVLGRKQVSEIQATVDTVFDQPPGLPITTALARALGNWHHVEHVMTDSGASRRTAKNVATVCYEGSHWLLMAGVDPNQTAPLIRNVTQLVSLLADGNASDWRGQLAAIASNPWGPHAVGLAELAEEADLPAVRLTVETVVKYYRKRLEKAEKAAVAREIRRLVQVSGVTQREFANYIGTSPSRLSTYANGIVTPSAAMLLRMRRTSQAVSAAKPGSRSDAPAVTFGQSSRQAPFASEPVDLGSIPPDLLTDFDD